MTEEARIRTRVLCLSVHEPKSLQPLSRIFQALETGEDDWATWTAIQEHLWHNLLLDFAAACGISYERRWFVRADDLGWNITAKPVLSNMAPEFYHKIVLVQVIKRKSECLLDAAILSQFTSAAVIELWKGLDKQDHEARIVNVLNSYTADGLQLCRSFFEGRKRGAEAHAESFQIITACLVLRELLTETASSFGIAQRSAPQIFGSSTSYTNIFAHLIPTMGRCPARAMSRFVNTTPLSFIANLPDNGDRSHSRCGQYGCKQDISASGFDGTHAAKCDHLCRKLWTSKSTLLRTIAARHIAVIPHDVQIQGSELIPVSAADRPYVAISHVWSHGLGESNVNSITSCQLDRIQRMAEQCYGGPVAIWLDTLCIPPAQVCPGPWRLAMDGMASVYRRAARVLALDHHLTSVAGGMLEMQVELLLCDWMHRLWTLQEMLLPSPDQVFVVFKHDMVCLTELLHVADLGNLTAIGIEVNTSRHIHATLQCPFPCRHESWLTHPIDQAYKHAYSWSQAVARLCDTIEVPGCSTRSHTRRQSDLLSAMFRNLSTLAAPTYWQRRLVGAGRMRETIEAIHTRAVSVPTDEPICLATLLAIELDQLPTKITMESIWSHIGTAPLISLCVKTDRLDTPGFGWCPNSLLGWDVSCSDSVFDGLRGVITDDGLLLQHDLLVFKAPSAWLTKPIVGIRGCYDSRRDLVCFSKMSRQRVASPQLGQDLALIRVPMDRTEDIHVGALIELGQTVDDIKHARWICSGYIVANFYERLQWDSSSQPEAEDWPVIDLTLEKDVMVCVD